MPKKESPEIDSEKYVLGLEGTIELQAGQILALKQRNRQLNDMLEGASDHIRALNGTITDEIAKKDAAERLAEALEATSKEWEAKWAELAKRLDAGND